MSDKKQEDSFFSNEDTIVRRAWIETAVQGVRSRLSSESTECSGIRDVAEGVGEAENELSPGADLSAEATGKRPRLYVAWSAEQRRSGT